MRAEDKEVDDRDLEQEEHHKRNSELVQEDEEELEEVEGERTREASEEAQGALLAAMRTILARNHLVVNDLKLSKREKQALEALKTAVDGRETERGQFVFGSDRRELLEQALAILQPGLATIDQLTPFKDLVHRVGELRHGLKDLEDAQDNLLDPNAMFDLAKADGEPGDKDDKPKPKPEPGDDLSLTGPPRKLPPKPPSSLPGPDVNEPPPPPTTLLGPAIKEVPRPPTSLTGPALKEPPPPPSTLEGPAIKAEPEGPTSLGDAAEIEAAAKPVWKVKVEEPVEAAPTEGDVERELEQKKKPWWRRPFGG